MTALILRLAALFAPADLRTEWLAEWRGELAYIERYHRKRTLAFACGAFRDAIWLRRHAEQDSRSLRWLVSPIRCLALLSVLAAASAVFALKSPALQDFMPVHYSDPAKLAMIRPERHGVRDYPEIPLAEFRASGGRIPHAVEAAFYSPRQVWLGARSAVVVTASPRLFAILGVPAPAQGLVLTRTTWRRNFDGDPHIVGRTVDLGGLPAKVSAVVSDAVWMLPGIADAWLLDDARLDAFPGTSRGYVVARLDAAPERLVWSTVNPDDRGAFGHLTFAAIPSHAMAVLNFLFFFVGIPLLLLPTIHSGGLGAYPAGRYAPSWPVRLRRWLFFCAKIGLLLPIVLCGSLALTLAPVFPGVIIISLIYACRWAITDQRNRCPVCLHSLSHPVRIGEASHMFLDWYGAELLCTRGHGLLHVPEIRTSCYAEQRWIYLDPSWRANETTAVS